MKRVQSVLLKAFCSVGGNRPFSNGIEGPVGVKNAVAIARSVAGAAFLKQRLDNEWR